MLSLAYFCIQQCTFVWTEGSPRGYSSAVAVIATWTKNMILKDQGFMGWRAEPA